MSHTSFYRFQLIINGYTTLAIASVGLISNVLGICFVSSGHRRGKLFNLLLTALFVVDSLFLSLEILRSIDLFFVPVPQRYLLMYDTILRCGLRWSMTSSILFSIAITHSRLAAVKNPFEDFETGVEYFADETLPKLLKYCQPIMFISTMVTTTVYWETDEEHLENGNIILVPSNLRLSPMYLTYYVGVLNFGLLGVFPLTSMTYNSYRLIQEIKRHNNIMTTLNYEISRYRATQQKNLTQSLVFIIFAFIGLHSLRLLNNFGELILAAITNKNEDSLADDDHIPNLFYYTSSLSELFMIIYCSINVWIYLYKHLIKSPPTMPTFNIAKILNRRRNAIVIEDSIDISGESLCTIGDQEDYWFELIIQNYDTSIDTSYDSMTKITTFTVHR